MTTGQKIAARRKELELSQEALGDKLRVSRQTVYKWESDLSLPDIDKLVALSRTFTLKKVACKAACEVNNLFNQSYDVIANYPMPGTNFKITLTIQL